MSKQPILLVEDSSDDIELTLRVLKAHNIANDIVIARDGEEALRFLFEENQVFSRELPAVVVLDLKMPKVGGLDVLRRIRAEPRTKQLPVVVMTTSSEDQDIMASYELGANSFVRKPVEFEEFEQAVRFLGLYWLILNVPPKS